MSSFSTQIVGGSLPRCSPRRLGSTYLEIQVAMVMLSIGMAGLYGLSVIQTRQTTRLEQMLPADDGDGADEIASINPVVNTDPAVAAWAKKLGIYADISNTGLVPTQSSYALHESVLEIMDNESPSGPSLNGGGGTWQEYVGHANPYGSSVAQISMSTSSGAYAYYIMGGIPPGEYEALAHVPAKNPALSGTFCTAVRYYVYTPADGWIVNMVNQANMRQDVEHDGKWWQSLGTYDFSSGTAYVFVRDSGASGDWLVADAIMIRPRPSWQPQTPVTETVNAGAQVTLELVE